MLDIITPCRNWLSPCLSDPGLLGVGSVSGRVGECSSFEPPLERDLVERTEENVTVDLGVGDPWPVPVGCPVD